MTKPLVDADVDISDFPYMPVTIARLTRSRAWLVCKSKPQLAFYMLNLWMAAWHGRPAASVEDDDRVLARAAQATMRRWLIIKEDALRGFVLCDDGRWYNEDLSSHARIAWANKISRQGRIIRRLEMESGEWDRIRLATFKRDGFRCQYCGSSGVRLECDHILPVSKGGSSQNDNLITACKPCNRSKGAKLLSEWRH